MRYQSTRNSNTLITSMEAIKQGISLEGGLFVPESIPNINQKELENLIGSSYQQRAVKILSLFLSDYSSQDISDCVYSAYDNKNFSSEKVAPVISMGGGLYIQELWHGPTSAFKDMALQILPHLMTTAIKRTGEERKILILTATSGDTGKAALEGFKDVDGTRIVVFYPQKGVSAMQRLQMVTQEGHNVKIVAVHGNFDDAQTAVKNIFGNEELKVQLADRGYQFSSANSINWGRLLPQIVYYFSAYLDMVEDRAITLGQSFNVVVPTGNFGNILAAYYARAMGLPINKLICASNDNNVLTDFIKTGIYDRRRDFHKTISPSMDILISSNLERLLYELVDRDDKQVKKWMKDLTENGEYHVKGQALNKLQSLFWGGCASTSETLQAISSTFKACSYTMDPHTAVGKWVYEGYIKETGDNRPTVLISTASPFKFPKDVMAAIGSNNSISEKEEWEFLEGLSEVSSMDIPRPLQGLTEKKVLHQGVCDGEEMVQEVLSFIKG